MLRRKERDTRRKSDKSVGGARHDETKRRGCCPMLKRWWLIERLRKRLVRCTVVALCIAMVMGIVWWNMFLHQRESRTQQAEGDGGSIVGSTGLPAYWMADGALMWPSHKLFRWWIAEKDDPRASGGDMASQGGERRHQADASLLADSRFFLVWSTSAETFTDREYAVLDSIFYHHPAARVTIYSEHLEAQTMFQMYLRAGYDIRVEPLGMGGDAEAIKEVLVPPDMPGVAAWLEKYLGCNAEDCPYLYSHMSDFFRFLVLLQHGGSYSDFDALYLRPIDAYRNAVGRDSSGAGGSCEWCLRNGDTYLAPGVLLNWEPGHPVIRRALEQAFNVETYDPKCFNCVGPRAFTEAYAYYQQQQQQQQQQQFDSGSSSLTQQTEPLRVRLKTRHRHSNGDAVAGPVHVLEPFQLYPLNWNEVVQHCGIQANTRDMYRNIVDMSLSFHMYGHMTRKQDVHPGSLIGLLMAANRLFRRESVPRSSNNGARETDDDDIVAIRDNGRSITHAHSGFELHVPHRLGVADHSFANVLRGPRLVCVDFDAAAQSGAFENPHFVLSVSSMRPALSLVPIRGGGGDDDEDGDSSGRGQQRSSSSSSSSSTSVQLVGTFLQVNEQLARLVYDQRADFKQMHSTMFSAERAHRASEGRDSLVFDLLMVSNNNNNNNQVQWRIRKVLELYEVARLVSVASKTLGRTIMLDRLLDSIRAMYPALPVVTANDGLKNELPQYAVDPAVSVVEVPYDAGLSFCRNRMVERAVTPFVLIIDDDFTFDMGSNLVMLLEQLMTRSYDIVAGKNPVDTKRFGLDFCGRLHVDEESRTLVMENSTYGWDGHCQVVDFVPNLFLGWRTALLHIGWDDRLKVGEHEDFFWRAKQMSAKVGTCPSISFTHHGTSHWLKRSWYDFMRQRVYRFFEIVMFKHQWTKIELFGITVFEYDLEEAHRNQGNTQHQQQPDDRRPVCAIGQTGANCDECLPGFGGLYCSECLPDHFGIECSQCKCSMGFCDDGMEGSGNCFCWYGGEDAPATDDPAYVACTRVPWPMIFFVVCFLFLTLLLASLLVTPFLIAKYSTTSSSTSSTTSSEFPIAV